MHICVPATHKAAHSSAFSWMMICYSYFFFYWVGSRVSFHKHFDGFRACGGSIFYTFYVILDPGSISSMLVLDAFGHMGLYPLCMCRASERAASIHFVMLGSPQAATFSVIVVRDASFCRGFSGPLFLCRFVCVALMGQIFQNIVC